MHPVFNWRRRVRRLLTRVRLSTAQLATHLVSTSEPARASALLKRKRLEHSSAAEAHPTVYGHVQHTRLFTGTCNQYLTGTRRGHSSRDAPRETPSHACAVEHSSTTTHPDVNRRGRDVILKRTRLEHSSVATHTRLSTGTCSTPSSRAGTCLASRQSSTGARLGLHGLGAPPLCDTTSRHDDTAQPSPGYQPTRNRKHIRATPRPSPARTRRSVRNTHSGATQRRRRV